MSDLRKTALNTHYKEEEMTLEIKPPEKLIEENPDKPAFYMADTGQMITRLQLDQGANQCAQMMRNMGLKNENNIAIFMENRPEFIEICAAASRSGLFYTAISTHLNISDAEYIVKDSGAKVLFTSAAMGETATALAELIPGDVVRIVVGGALDGFEPYEEKRDGYPIEPIPDQAAGRDMLYSSGTTGRPKGVVTKPEELPYGEIDPSYLGLVMLFQFTEESIYLSPAPLYHAAPLRFVLLTLRLGGTVVIMPKFDAEQSLELIEKYKISHSQWVPTMFVRMLKLADEQRTRYDLSSHQVAIHAAAPIGIEVKEKMIDWWGPILIEYYAGTEGNGLCAIGSQDWLTHKGSVGPCFIGTPKILDEAGNELPQGEVGAIYFADGNDFEYLNDPKKTASSRNDKGWTTLDDVGYLDKDGFVYLTDRQSNMIISGGVNIYPQESENLLVMHPKVMDAAVIGVPHEEFGEEVKGVVQLRDLSEAGPGMEQELLDYCRAHLSKIKCPVSIDFNEELPRTPTGKLLKRLLKDKYWKEQKRRI